LTETRTPVAVFRPQLPKAERLLPYLRRIDSARIYTNWGPLSAELEERLAARFQIPRHAIVSASSGTAALTGAILAAAGRAVPSRPLAMVPGFTFVATAIAAEQCGYEPYVIDVDPQTWAADPSRLVSHVLCERIGLVIAAAPFGRPVPHDGWRTFRARTGIPVIIDGGASFEGLSQAPGAYLSEIPTALSFHATKSFSTGEGGCVLTTDGDLAQRIVRCLNFGFHTSRDSASASTNGKMSEYHAAIGLAELDAWDEKRTAFAGLADRYRYQLADAGLHHQFVGAPDVAGCYALFLASSVPESAEVQERLSASNLEYRLWYGRGILGHEYFRALPHDPLDSTRRLADLLIGLPVAVDLSDSAVLRVVAALTLPGPRATRRESHYPNSPAR